MMILRNGIRSALRARGRTVLFFSLILLLCAVLTLALGMWSYSARTLSDMDDNYTSVALIEYMGENYPAADMADADARDAATALNDDSIFKIPGIRLWERTDQTFAAMDGYTRTAGTIPYEDYYVFVSSDLTPMYREGTEWTNDPSRIPENCILIDTVTTDRTYYASGLEPYFVPRYYRIDGELYRYTLQDGAVTMAPVDASQLPERYFLIDGEDGQYFNVNLTGYGNAIESEAVLCYYNPATGLYGVPGQELYAYIGSLDRILHGHSLKEGTIAVIEIRDTGFVAESGKSYVFHAVSADTGTKNTTLALTDFYDGCETPPYMEVSGEADPQIEQSLFYSQASRYALANNYIRLEASDHISAMECFQQGAVFLEQGRFPEAGETGVCVIDGWTAEQMALSPGDTVTVRLLTSSENDRFDLTETSDSRTLKVTGITNPSGDYTGCVWVSSAEGGFKEPLFGDLLGQAVLENPLALRAADALESIMPSGVRVTLYDQGYAQAAQPLKAMEAAAMGIAAACICACLVVLFLFAFLFVGRQKENALILSSLGTEPLFGRPAIQRVCRRR